MPSTFKLWIVGVIFKDWSKIELFFINDFNDLKYYKDIQWFNILKEEEILLWKLKNILDSEEFWEKQKIHLLTIDSNIHAPIHINSKNENIEKIVNYYEKLIDIFVTEK